jgi:L-ascorbate metabolism protein UlaG (beta-lactamase superfamily)
MRITWYGHAAFGIEADGVRIILDPYRSPDAGGYEPVGDEADVVVVSHENDKYHSHLGQIAGAFEVVRGPEIPPGGIEARGIRFEAIPCFETPEKLPGDEVTILHFRAEGLHVVHLGDLGHALTEAEVAPILGAEIALVPAGGPPTIDFPLIGPLLDAIGPRVVIPMHFKTPKINLDIQPVERFLEALPGWPVERTGTSTYEVGPESLPDGRRIVRLEFAR